MAYSKLEQVDCMQLHCTSSHIGLLQLLAMSSSTVLSLSFSKMQSSSRRLCATKCGIQIRKRSDGCAQIHQQQLIGFRLYSFITNSKLFSFDSLLIQNHSAAGPAWFSIRRSIHINYSSILQNVRLFAIKWNIDVWDAFCSDSHRPLNDPGLAIATVCGTVFVIWFVLFVFRKN